MNSYTFESIAWHSLSLMVLLGIPNMPERRKRESERELDHILFPGEGGESRGIWVPWNSGEVLMGLVNHGIVVCVCGRPGRSRPTRPEGGGREREHTTEEVV